MIPVPIIVIIIVSLLLFTVISKGEGFDVTPSSQTSQPCQTGHWCPTLGGGDTMYPCPGGTYGDSPSLETPSCSGPCQEGCVCDASSTDQCAAPCPAGYYCLAGTGGPIAPIICPQGYFCPESSSEPTICPAGVFCAIGTASI